MVQSTLFGLPRKPDVLRFAPMNADDLLLETWAQELADLGQHVPHGLLAMSLAAYQENDQTRTKIHLDVAMVPRVQMDAQGEIQPGEEFQWPAPALARRAELTGESGPFGRVSWLLWKRWHAPTMARAEELKVDMASVDVIQTVTWPAGSAEQSLAHLLFLDPPHQARYRARQLEARLVDAPDGKTERL